MERQELKSKLKELKGKQRFVEAAWQKAGDRRLMQFFVDIIPKALNAERCSVFILDPQRQNVWLQCGTGLAERDVSVPIHSSIVGRVIGTGEPYISHELENEVGAHDVVGVRTGFVTRSALCVPIFGVSRETVTGAIQVLNKKSGRFTEEDQDILDRLAFHLQMNIEDLYMRQEMARIFEEMSSQIKQLEDELAGRI